MVNDFLKKYQEELISEKILLKEDMDLLETKIKEETKFLALLEESNESYFKEFTPRNINAKNMEKAEEIKNNLKDLQSDMDDKSKKMKFYDGRLSELNSIINNTVVINKPAKIENSTNESITFQSNDLKNRLYSVKNMIVLDPYRAKIELENIISSL
ncbi:MAG: hypothetical protein K6F66_03595 [Pseudobutyrivibrio sp.]|nr:hypothetical protein [Pseudobutyrivibrio sp.]